MDCDWNRPYHLRCHNYHHSSPPLDVDPPSSSRYYFPKTCKVFAKQIWGYIFKKSAKHAERFANVYMKGAIRKTKWEFAIPQIGKIRIRFSNKKTLNSIQFLWIKLKLIVSEFEKTKSCKMITFCSIQSFLIKFCNFTISRILNLRKSEFQRRKLLKLHPIFLNEVKF